jgi:hypothetical protein
MAHLFQKSLIIIQQTVVRPGGCNFLSPSDLRLIVLTLEPTHPVAIRDALITHPAAPLTSLMAVEIMHKNRRIYAKGLVRQTGSDSSSYLKIYVQNISCCRQRYPATSLISKNFAFHPKDIFMGF